MERERKRGWRKRKRRKGTGKKDRQEVKDKGQYIKLEEIRKYLKEIKSVSQKTVLPCPLQHYSQ